MPMKLCMRQNIKISSHNLIFFITEEKEPLDKIKSGNAPINLLRRQKNGGQSRRQSENKPR